MENKTTKETKKIRKTSKILMDDERLSCENRKRWARKGKIKESKKEEL